MAIEKSFEGTLNTGKAAEYARQVLDTSVCVIPGVIDPAKIDLWYNSFLPLLNRHIEREGHRVNRGPNRYYVTLPFVEPFADPEIFENDLILSVVENLVGKDGVMCQLATDTPLKGSEYQDIHRDTQLLFPETGKETPPYQLAVNFPLVDMTMENGPFEAALGTHMLSKEEGLRRIETGEAKLEPFLLKKGDVMVRDVRHLHRGTPNHTDTPRPMVVIGYSRRWLFRPEVNIQVPRANWDKLSERARFWLRFNPIVEEVKEGEEKYQSFAF
jgi:ectoine hydroxylase-related dioxygenase (phytanoyl-CoA dioxygenase family)